MSGNLYKKSEEKTYQINVDFHSGRGKYRMERINAERTWKSIKCIFIMVSDEIQSCCNIYLTENSMILFESLLAHPLIRNIWWLRFRIHKI